MPTPMPSNISVLFLERESKGLPDLHMLPFAVGARRRNVILDVGQEQGQRGEQQRQAPDGKERGTPAVMLRQNPGDRGAESQPHGHGGVIGPDDRTPSRAAGPTGQHGYGNGRVAGVAYADHEAPEHYQEKV